MEQDFEDLQHNFRNLWLSELQNHTLGIQFAQCTQDLFQSVDIDRAPTIADFANLNRAILLDVLPEIQYSDPKTKELKSITITPQLQQIWNFLQPFFDYYATSIDPKKYDERVKTFKNTIADKERRIQRLQGLLTFEQQLKDAELTASASSEHNNNSARVVKSKLLIHGKCPYLVDI